MTEKLSHFLVDIIDTICQDPGDINVKSTKEVTARIMEANKTLEQIKPKDGGDEEIVIGSVKALYVQIQPKKAAKEIENSIIESSRGIESECVEIVDYVEISKFLAENMDENEIRTRGLEDLIPIRKSKIGMTNKEINAKARRHTPKMNVQDLMEIIIDEIGFKGQEWPTL